MVYVNDLCALGFTHNEMVNVFESIGSGETVILEVCRGYSLPFDPNDPNNEVVTTIAVNAPDILTKDPSLYMDLNRPGMRPNGRFDFIDGSPYMGIHPGVPNGENMATISSVNSMPDLCISEKINAMNSIKRPCSTDILLNDSADQSNQEDSHSPPPSKRQNFIVYRL